MSCNHHIPAAPAEPIYELTIDNVGVYHNLRNYIFIRNKLPQGIPKFKLNITDNGNNIDTIEFVFGDSILSHEKHASGNVITLSVVYKNQNLKAYFEMRNPANVSDGFFIMISDESPNKTYKKYETMLEIIFQAK